MQRSKYAQLRYDMVWWREKAMWGDVSWGAQMRHLYMFDNTLRRASIEELATGIPPFWLIKNPELEQITANLLKDD